MRSTTDGGTAGSPDGYGDYGNKGPTVVEPGAIHAWFSRFRVYRLDEHRSARMRERSRSPERPGHDGYLQTFEDLDRESRERLADSFLTGCAARKEARLQDLNAAVCLLYGKAMENMCTSWKQFDAVGALMETQKREFLEGGGKPVGTRWVFTIKNDLLRATRPGLGISAKARLVFRGCQERTTIRPGSPMPSLLAFHLLRSFTASARWAIRRAGASNAYLLAGGTERMLVLRPQAPLPPGVQRGDLIMAKGSIYATRDAGRVFWLHLRGLFFRRWLERARPSRPSSITPTTAGCWAS